MEHFNKLLEIVRKQECGNLIITRNGHKACYESIEEYLDFLQEDLDLELIKKCEEIGEIWMLQLYPKTPTGFFTTWDSNLEEACRKMCAIFEGK